VTNVLSWSAPKKAKVRCRENRHDDDVDEERESEDVPRRDHSRTPSVCGCCPRASPDRSDAPDEDRKECERDHDKGTSGGSTKSDADTARQCKRFGGSLRYILARTRRSAI
jgi:hypothetical protein